MLVGRRAEAQIGKRNACVVKYVKYAIGKKNNQLSQEQREQIQSLVNVPVEFESKDNDCPMMVVVEHGETKRYRPEALSAFVLRHMLKNVREEMHMPADYAPEVVISVPARFTNVERQATKDAGEIAGCKVLRIMNEPTCAVVAAINRGLLPEPEDFHRVLVMDFGGGTYDVTLGSQHQQMIFEVTRTDGDVMMGGSDVTQAIAKFLLQTFNEMNDNSFNTNEIWSDRNARRKLIRAAEYAKIDVNTRDMTRADISIPELWQGNDFDMDFTLKQFEKIFTPTKEKLFNIVDNVLKTEKLSYSDLHQVILVGGSCRIKKIRETLIEKGVPEKLVNTQLNMDESIAEGAALMAHMVGKYSNDTENQLLLIDVTPMNICIRTNDDNATPLIMAGKAIPARVSQTFTTQSHNQTGVTIHVSEGSSELASSNHLLGVFELTGIEQARRGVPQIEVTFDVDVNGILNVTAKDKKTGVEHTVNMSEARMSNEQVKAYQESAKKTEERDKKIAALLRKKSTVVSTIEDLNDRLETQKQHPKYSEAASELQTHKMQVMGYNTSNIDQVEESYFDNVLEKIQQHAAVGEVLQAAGGAPGAPGANVPPAAAEPVVEEAD